jgi:predicted acetyltransferase
MGNDNIADSAVLVEAKGDDLLCIENLMQFYNYALSKSYPLNFADNGLYTIRSKKSYWSKPSVRPYLIRVGTALAGFAVVDEEVVDHGSAHNLGYLFVALRYQGNGYGKSIVYQLLDLHPGHWEIYHLADNLQAKRFWTDALNSDLVSNFAVSARVIDEQASVLYKFSTNTF